MATKSVKMQNACVLNYALSVNVVKIQGDNSYKYRFKALNSKDL